MNTLLPKLILSFTILVALFFQQEARGSVNGVIGVIIDNTTRVGKEAKVGIEMALDDFNTNSTNPRLVMHIRNSQGKPLHAALAARDLIDTQQVKVILGLYEWDEGSLIAEIASQDHVPTISLADSTPQWATKEWSFLVEASPSQHAQMKAVAAIVQSWGWRQVILIYEDIDSTYSTIIPYLSDALQEVSAAISHLVALPPFASSSISEELERLKSEQCKVFVVHSSLASSVRLFQAAKKIKMMEKGYVWITTNKFTDLIHSINASTISSMQGILGVKNYFPQTGKEFQDFNKRFRKRFSVEHPEEGNNEPGISAMQAYDATKVVALALNKTNMGGQKLLENVSQIDFNGFSGKVKFIERKLVATQKFCIVNVIGKSYRELGFWSDELGFSETIDHGATYNSSMQILGQIFWPGGPWNPPRGWTLPTITDPLKVGVPTESAFKQFVNVVYEQQANTFSCTGFSIEIFKETVNRLPYYLPYEFVPFNGTYNDLVKQVYLKKLDAVAGDVAIVARRYEYAEFTHPYTESGLVMVVPVQSQMSNKAWLFTKPFTKAMWALIIATNIYNGFVVWLIERNHRPELKGSASYQIGTLLWLASTTLFSLQGGKLHSNLSRMATMVWLFVALVIMQSYTASLSSMLTVQRLEPKVANIETLKNSNAIVGYGQASFVARYLVDVLGFKPKNVKNFTSPEGYAQAFKSGDIAAVFFEVPCAKLFLAKYCKSFTIAGPTYKVGGFGFVFPKGSPLLPDVTEALLNVSESGTLREIENNMLGSEKCVDVESSDENASLSLNSFWVLFALTGGTSTVALMVYVVVGKSKLYKSRLEHKWVLSTLRIHLSDDESTRNPPNSPEHSVTAPFG